MKYGLMLLFLIPLNLSFWSYQVFLFLFTFLFILLNFNFFFWCNLSYFLGIDLLSYSLIILSCWICSLMILASEKVYKLNNFVNLFILMISLLMVVLFFTFSSMNLFMFYLFFEISLIPTLILIMGWGYQPERLEAGVYMLFYTMLMSLPMLILLFYMYVWGGSLVYFLLMDLDYLYFYFMLNMVFFVKIPMFFLHLWLPKAHVEAPVSGSMILAGVMLKLGGYGLLRLIYILKKFLNLNLFMIVLSVYGGLMISLVCIRQSDMKSLIAYSSVAHMGMALAGVLTLKSWGLLGSFSMMVAHGLSSSGLFSLANLSYERSLSRSIYMNKGMMSIMPKFSLWWFLLLSSSMAAPLSLNFFSEIMLIYSISMFSNLLMFYLFMLIFFSAVYSLYLFSYLQHGKYPSNIFNFSMLFYREYLLLFLHWVPLNLLFLKLVFIQWV
uniref:NADH dehydrogenase subunit 4 n=1 Tax=Phyllotreta striolata TaxID=444603 RepID=UPI0013B3CACF|nr:NADH dehydrogenase subunit 4 [Phyllotreta striolata]QHR79689.1 NADH dehydrogenase subunit 4 [Phyllotreta striolata]